MASETAVLKCRDCGSIYSLSYTEDAHRERDHCDGNLEKYCMTCKSFFDAFSCPGCSERLGEDAECRLRRRQQAIARWRSFPIISHIDKLVRLNPICRRALEDWEYRAGLQALERRLCVCFACGFLAGVLIPAFLKFPSLAGVTIFGIYVFSLKRLPSA